jgi:hypothetical protein
MKIRFVEPSPKAGTVEHVAASVAHNLIAAGFAELCPLPPRGSTGWLEQRNEQAKLAVPLNSAVGDDSVSVPFAATVEWQLRDRLTLTGSVAIIRRFQYLTEVWDQSVIAQHGYPKDCPENIVKRYEALTRQPFVDNERLEVAQRKQNDYNNSIANARRW